MVVSFEDYEVGKGVFSGLREDPASLWNLFLCGAPILGKHEPSCKDDRNFARGVPV